MDTWPEGDKTASFSALTEPVVKAIRQAYKLTRKKRSINLDWTGPPLPRMMAATCFDFAERLTASNLKYSEEDQGSDALNELVGAAVQLGMEQGRRWQLGQGRPSLDMARILAKEVLRLE